mmetsp:Transcript_4935/g.10712  ORF Transcript_4935/g.10712 Transcript_4935/m.10712 type:complete len:161 (+) Transcript_4935:250-732(+)
MSAQQEPHRKRMHNGDWAAPPAKRSGPTISSLQRELQQEREKTRRALESVEQLRLEMQMMGRLFAAAREQIVVLGGATLAPEVSVVMPTAKREASSRPDVKLVQRVQSELAESKGECKRLAEQVKHLRSKLDGVASTRDELAAAVNDMQEFLNTAWNAGC